MPVGGEATSLIEIHDSEVARIGEVLAVLKEKQEKGGVYLEGFSREAVDRFAAVGFKVEVKWFSTNVEGVYIPEIEIQERLEGTFDYDRQVHEVTNDLLGLGEGGVIKGGM